MLSRGLEVLGLPPRRTAAPGGAGTVRVAGRRTRPCGLLYASRLRPPPPPLVYRGGLRSCRTAWSGGRWSMRFSTNARFRAARHIGWLEQQLRRVTARPRAGRSVIVGDTWVTACAERPARGAGVPAATPSRGRRRRARARPRSEPRPPPRPACRRIRCRRRGGSPPSLHLLFAFFKQFVGRYTIEVRKRDEVCPHRLRVAAFPAQ